MPRALIAALGLCLALRATRAEAFSDVPWTPRAVSDRCEALARAPLDAMERIMRAHRPPMPFDRDAWRCIDARVGAWLWLPMEPRFDLDHRWSARAALWFIAPDGSARAIPEQALGAHARIDARSRRSLDEQHPTGSIALTLQREGIAPIVVSPEGVSTLDDPIDSTTVEDIDADGDGDLVHEARFALRSRCALADTPETEPAALSWVALREGGRTLRESDEARAWLRIQCPSAPSVLVPDPRSPHYRASRDLRTMVHRIACARAWGASVEQLRERLPQRWPSELACVSREDLLAFAQQIRPPFALTELGLPPRGAPFAFAPSPQRVGEPVLARLSFDHGPAAMRRACAPFAIAEATMAALDREQLGAPYFATAFLRDAGRCRRSSDERAWVDELGPLRVTRDHNDERELRATVRLLSISRTGARVASGSVPQLRSVERTQWWSLVGAHDFNGDGASEAIVERVSTPLRTARSERIVLLEAREGQVLRYRPSLALPAPNAVIDLDGDGGRDLLDTAHFSVFDPRTMDFVIEGPAFVAHAQRDGSFSVDDAAAVAFARAQCPSDPSAAIVVRRDGQPAVDLEQTVHRIGCARAYGASAEHIVARMLAALTEDERASIEPPLLAALRLALRVAPLRLR